jgi:hypothetical protein
MPILLDPPPVRTGRCALTLRINGQPYRIEPVDLTADPSRTWRLTAAAGHPRVGKSYRVTADSRLATCNCPDADGGARCKHIGALSQLGLISRSAATQAQLDWRATTPGAKARRRHKPSLPAPGAQPAAGGAP